MEETRFDADLNRTKIDREETSFDAATKFDKDVVVNNKIGSQQQTPKIPAQENAEGGRSSSGMKIAAGVAAGAAIGGGAAYAMVNGGIDAIDEYLGKDAAGKGKSSVNVADAVADESEGQPEWTDAEINVATGVTDEMSFGEAFAAARAEVGAGGAFEWRGEVYNTYYESEWDAMSAEEKAEFSEHFDWGKAGDSDVAGTDNVQVVEAETGVEVADSVNDSMSFGEAFAAARAEVGPGGVFEWHGQTFNTYNADEWSAMSDEQKNDFNALASHATESSDGGLASAAGGSDSGVNVFSQINVVNVDVDVVATYDNDSVEVLGVFDDGADTVDVEAIIADDDVIFVDVEDGRDAALFEAGDPLNADMMGLDCEDGFCTFDDCADGSCDDSSDLLDLLGI